MPIEKEGRACARPSERCLFRFPAVRLLTVRQSGVDYGQVPVLLTMRGTAPVASPADPSPLLLPAVTRYQ